MTNNDAAVYDAMFSVPGMSEQVKVDFKMSRKNLLLLEFLLERGLSGKENTPGGLGNIITEDTRKEFLAFAADCLQKAGLTEFSEKLKALAKRQ